MQSSAHPSSSTNAGPARVLVVDDDPMVRRVTRTLLGYLGYTTAEASNGDECMKVLGTVMPEVILLDMLMPEKDGIETLREIRANDSITPIIAMSGGSRVDAALCLRFASNLGAPLVLLKPFTADELGAALELALKRRAEALEAHGPRSGLTA